MLFGVNTRTVTAYKAEKLSIEDGELHADEIT
jgi:hypothetical protein